MVGAPFTNMAEILIRAWICNHMRGQVWNEITYPLPNFNGVSVEV